MAEMSLEVQEQKMMEMRSYLGNFCMILNNRIDGLKERLEQYVLQGFPLEIARYYTQSYYTPEKQEIDQLIQKIQTEHYDYIDDVVSAIVKARNLQ